MDVNGGMRMATQSHTKGYVTISGTADLHFRGADVQLGRQRDELVRPGGYERGKSQRGRCDSQTKNGD